MIVRSDGGICGAVLSMSAQIFNILKWIFPKWVQFGSIYRRKMTPNT